MLEAPVLSHVGNASFAVALANATLLASMDHASNH